MTNDLSNHPLAVEATIALYRLLNDEGGPEMTESERTLIDASSQLLWRGLHHKQLAQMVAKRKNDSVALVALK